eukprot:Nk52_evm1s2072 gene=Nk52_evmTU1s2072
MSCSDRKDSLLSLTEDLCRIPSASNDIPQNITCLDHIQALFRSTRWSLTRFCKTSPSKQHHPALYISSRPQNSKSHHSKVLHLCHIDVVPADAYDCQLKKKKGGSTRDILYGRGVSDMKGPVACILHMLLAIEDPSQYDLAVLIVSDEEIGGLDGAKYCFLDEDGPKVTYDVCFIADGGDGFKLVTHEKGVLRFTLTPKDAKAAHSAYPWLGRNGIIAVMDDLQRILKCTHPETGEEIFNNPNTNKSAQDTGGVAFPHWYTTMVPTLIEGGTAVNQVPGTACVTVDVRYTEVIPLDKLKQFIVDSSQACNVDFFFEQPILFSDPRHPYMIRAHEEMETVLGRPVELSRGHGTSDGHWAPPGGSCIIMYKPDGGDLHQKNEWVDLDSLCLHFDITSRLTELWARKS